MLHSEISLSIFVCDRTCTGQSPLSIGGRHPNYALQPQFHPGDHHATAARPFCCHRWDRDVLAANSPKVARVAGHLAWPVKPSTSLTGNVRDVEQGAFKAFPHRYLTPSPCCSGRIRDLPSTSSGRRCFRGAFRAENPGQECSRSSETAMEVGH